MIFENYFNVTFKKKIFTIIVLSYSLVLTVLFFSFILAAKENASESINIEMVKELETLQLTTEANLNENLSDIKILVENNSLIMPLNLGLKPQLTDFILSEQRKGRKGLNSIIIVDKKDQIIFNNTKLKIDLNGYGITDEPYSCYIFKDSLVSFSCIPVFYTNTALGEEKRRIGAILAVYDFFDFKSAIQKEINMDSYEIFGFKDNKLRMVINKSTVKYIDNPVNNASLYKFKEGFSDLVINGENTHVLLKNIRLSNSETPFTLTLGVLPPIYKATEFKYIYRGVFNCSLTALIITAIFLLVYFLLNHYLKKELSIKLEIQSLREQRHDFSKHLSVIAGMAHMGEYDDLKKYMEELGHKVVYEGNLSKLDHPPLCALIHEKELILHENNIKFLVDINTGLKKIDIDPTDICTTVGNILDNAFEACIQTDSNSKFIHIYIGYYSGMYAIRISNTGKPIEEKFIEKLFRPGYTTKTKQKGTGMGLYIVKKILKKYRGSIGVESSNGVNTFSVYLHEKP